MAELLAAHAAQLFAAQSPNLPQKQPLSQADEANKVLQDSNEVEECFRKLQLNEPTSNDGELYVHQGLANPGGQIRLFLLAPSANQQARIDCTIQTVTLDESRLLKFNAISYACGDQNNRKDIFINGRRLSVTFNLEEAIKGLRHATRFQRFWADAICIHQTDLSEKSKQIQLMRDIYSLSTEVTIWLGESDRELELLFSKLATFDPNDMTQQTSYFYQTFQFADESNDILAGFIKLYQKPWFSRVWCTQESLLASKTPTAVCGKSRAPWKVINNALIAIDMIWPSKKSATQKKLQEASKHSMSGALGVNFEVNKRLTLSMALQSTASKNATDPRDKVYAVLGLVSPEIRAALAPDYSQSLSQVYQDTMMAMFKEHMTLNPLWAAAGSSRDNTLQLPSWSLDFSDTKWQQALTALHDFPLMWGPSVIPNSPVPWFEHNARNSSLSIDCTIVGTLETPSPMTFAPSLVEHTRIEKLLTNDPAAGNTLDLTEIESEIVFQFLQSVKMATESFYQIGSSRFGAKPTAARIQAGEVWKTFLRGHTIGNLLGPIWTKASLPVPKDFSLFESYLQRSSHVKPEPSTWEIEIPPHIKSQISQPKLMDDCIIKSCLALARAIPDRTFIMTDTGYLGNASTNVKKGDVLCVVPTCRQPLILRPLDRVDEKGRHVYNLVASVWVEALMKKPPAHKGNRVVLV